MVVIWGLFIVDVATSTCGTKDISENVNKSSFSSSISSKQAKYLFLLYGEIDFVKSVKLTLFNFICFD